MTDDGNHHSEKNIRRKEKIVHPKRWYILLMYVLIVMCNFSQWLQYYMIPNEISKFYEVTEREISWTYYVMIGAFSPLALPAASLVDKISLRRTAILGSTGSFLGSLIKLFSATPGGFYVTMAGQTVLAISLSFMVSVPQKLSRTWFGEREVSLACGIGYGGLRLSMIIGYFLPPLLMSNQENPMDIKKNLLNMFIYFATASFFVAVLVVCTFRDIPPLPPTLEAQVQQEESQKDFKTNLLEFIKCLKRILSQRCLLAFFVTTGISNGCFDGLCTLLNEVFLKYFPNEEIDVGRIGMTMIATGMAASIAYGFILDKTKQFKAVLMVVFYMAAVSMATFTILLVYCKTVWVIYFGAALVGTFLCGFTAVSYEVATELTYPESEYIVVTVMQIMSLLVEYSTTHTFRYINTNSEYHWGNVGFVVTLFFGATCTLPIKFEFERTEATSNNKEVEIEVEAEELLHSGFTSLDTLL